jgi:hypothetical protein
LQGEGINLDNFINVGDARQKIEDINKEIQDL